MMIVVFGPPGFLWKLPNFKETLVELELDIVRMRLCHFGVQYDTQCAAPSGSYIQVATTVQLPYRKFGCHCKIGSYQHKLDWHGKNADHAAWRRKVLLDF